MPFEGVGTLFFQDTKSQPAAGWSETYWLTGTDYSMAESNLSQIATARYALLTDSIDWIGGRVSDRTVRGDALVLVPPGIGGVQPGTFGGVGAPSTSPWTAILLRLEATPMYHASRFLHGVPANQISGEAYLPTTAFETALTAYSNALIANARLRVRDKTVPPPRPFVYRTITSVHDLRLAKRDIGRPFGLSHGRRLIR